MGISENFFRSCELSEVTLRVRDLARVTGWYEQVLGVAPEEKTNGRVVFAVPGTAHALLVLESDPAARERALGAAGLFHFAVLYPSRESLGRVARALIERSIPFGTGDHGVSEALYLQDPEDNGVELYVDRPHDLWPMAANGDVAMYTEAVDLGALIKSGEQGRGDWLPAGTRIGHVHLSVSDLERAKAFYGGVLGFSIRQRNFPGALFLGRDGYHHHIGANVWRSRSPAKPDTAGLRSFTIQFADAAELRRIAERARADGFYCEEMDGGLRVIDGDGIACRLRGGQ
jgi:Predicted ring-cleavage extradiol dioxygenase